MDHKREELVNGLREPEAEELAKLEEYKEPTAEKGKSELDVEQLKASKGFPQFWLKAMENSRILKHYIKEHDEPILKFLTNVKTERLNDNDYKLTFTFAPNEYFKNTELTKTMIMDKEDSDICKETIGTEIQWNEGKNVTMKTIKKKQKNKSIPLVFPEHKTKKKTIETKAVREVTKTVEEESLFNFFKSRKAPEGKEEEEGSDEQDEEREKLIEAIENDIDIAEEFVNEVVPRALYYYMGLMEEEEMGIGEDEDEDSEGSEGEAKPKGGKKKEKRSEDSGAEPKAESKKECKQQ